MRRGETDANQVMYDQYFSTHYSHLSPLSHDEMVKYYARSWDRVLPDDRNISCLDLGCGPGFFLYYLRRRGFQQIEGVDLSPEHVAVGGQVGLPIALGDALDFMRRVQLERKHYGLIVMTDVLEHLSLEKILEILRLTVSSLHDTGRLFLQVPNAASVLSNYSCYMDITHQRLFTEDSLRQVLLQSGFTHVQWERYINPTVAGLLQRAVRRAVYWMLYRLLDGRRVPQCVDKNLMAVASVS